MHTHQIENFQHNHMFNIDKKGNESRTRIVVIITFVAMFVEIAVGWLTNSMALYADGWHMGTHAFALGISVIAYSLARKYARDERFTFGTWKIEILGAFSSAIILGVVGLLMIFTSVERLANPLVIQLDEAIIVTIVGLIVNVICALILNAGGGHSHAHFGEEEHEHDHDHEHLHELEHDHGQELKHEDLNLKSAYVHVLTDALTSILAIIALFGAKYFNLYWLDPFMGVVGAVLILRWSFFLLRDTSNILLDRQVNTPLKKKIIGRMESDGDTRVCDIHLWKVEQNRYACIVSLVSGNGVIVDEFKNRLQDISELSHITVETNPCQCEV
jgi:cation diffusion facilitator family transporter